MAAALNRLLESPRASAGAILAASLALLAGAFAFQEIGGLDPCVLCVWQRYPYAVTIGLSATALVLAGQGRAHGTFVAPLLTGLSALAFAVGGGIAVYHVGVEQGWFQPSAACTGAAIGEAETIEELKARIEAAPLAHCDEVPWSLFGVSLAGYNLLASAALATLSGLACFRQLAHRAAPHGVA